MNTAVLEDAIYDRLNADTGTGGLVAVGASLVSNIYNGMRNPTDTLLDKPYIVFEVDEYRQDETYGDSGVVASVVVHVFDKPRGGTANCRSVLDRIFGNWKPTTPPSYGLHRWSAGAIAGTNYAITMMRRVSGATDHTDDYFHYAERYEAVVTDSRA